MLTRAERKKLTTPSEDQLRLNFRNSTATGCHKGTTSGKPTMSNQTYQIKLTTGTGMPNEPFEVLASEDASSSDVTAYMRDHIQRMAAQKSWNALEILECKIHTHGLRKLYSVEVNYEMEEQNETDYYSALIWYDITQPFTQIEASEHLKH